jgi:hypothetical protein
VTRVLQASEIPYGKPVIRPILSPGAIRKTVHGITTFLRVPVWPEQHMYGYSKCRNSTVSAGISPGVLRPWDS